MQSAEDVSKSNLWQFKFLNKIALLLTTERCDDINHLSCVL